MSEMFEVFVWNLRQNGNDYLELEDYSPRCNSSVADQSFSRRQISIFVAVLAIGGLFAVGLSNGVVLASATGHLSWRSSKTSGGAISGFCLVVGLLSYVLVHGYIIWQGYAQQKRKSNISDSGRSSPVSLSVQNY